MLAPKQLLASPQPPEPIQAPAAEGAVSQRWHPGRFCAGFVNVTPGVKRGQGCPRAGGAGVTRRQAGMGMGDRHPREEHLQGESPSLKAYTSQEWFFLLQTLKP